jgi:uncharacterized RDD family membrane protein YckC
MTPPLRRRLASMLYEAMLLFGVLFVAAWLFSTLLQQRNALYLREGLEVWLFFVLGLYFIWCWTHGGQTLPMKTWRIRLVTTEGLAVSPGRALVRYVFSWFWFLPGLALAKLVHAQAWMLVVFPAINMVLWAMTILFDKDRQFLHDRLAGTRLIVCVAPPAA